MGRQGCILEKKNEEQKKKHFVGSEALLTSIKEKKMPKAKASV